MYLLSRMHVKELQLFIEQLNYSTFGCKQMQIYNLKIFNGANSMFRMIKNLVLFTTNPSK